MPEQEVQIPPGIIAVTTYGQIQAKTAQSLLDLSRHLERKNLRNIAVQLVHGALVDKARNEAARQLLQSEAQWLWFLDGDMVFQPDIVDHILATAFLNLPHADIVGGYCNLKGGIYLPTIDRGSGQWEPHDANQGPLEVIRTGTACLLIKRHVFERMAYPWFGVRPAPRPLDMLTEVDNFARCKFDGKNPLHGESWTKLQDIARHEALVAQANHPQPYNQFGAVGEDSSFCDKAKALGFTIVVQTNAICRHIDEKIIGPEAHMEALNAARTAQDHLAGIA